MTSGAAGSGSSDLDRVEEVFARVVDLPADERASALDSQCGDDHELRREVESLLASDGGSTFIVDLVSGGARALGDDIERRMVGRRVGAWRVTGILGRGGMGAVYEVSRDDGAFNQRAALKLIRADVDSGIGRRRFREERQILAQLNHPNIAKLLDGGESEDGAPYLVMEAVDGMPITDYCETGSLSIEERLRTFITVCHAVHFAHTQLIVHRDLKPSNILVGDDGVVKLLDFGIARLLGPGGERAVTLLQDVALTPEYASPEQVRADPVSTSTDIYSLGAVLYQLLTGVTAHIFSRYGFSEVSRVICEVEPAPPSQMVSGRESRRLRGDIDNIVLTALRKDALRRYASAEQLAEDLERHLEGRPVAARRDTFGYRSGKFIKRNRLAVAAVSLVLVSLVAGIVGTVSQAQRAERRFEEVRNLANTFLFRFHDEIRELPGSTPARELIVTTALEYLDKLSRDARYDADLQMELAAAYEKVGDVLGNPSNPNLGRIDDALASHEKALQLRMVASGRAVDTELEGRAVLQSHIKLAEVLISAGRTDESQRHADHAAELAAQFGTPVDRLQTITRHAELALRRGDLDTAEQRYREVMSIATAEARRRPGRETSALLANAAGRLGYVYKVASRQSECLQALGVALEALQRLSAEEPSRTGHVRQIMKLHEDRGDALRSPFASEGMRPDLSLAEYEEALRRAEWLAAADPSEFSARMNVFLERAQIADTWREIDPEKSLPLFREIFPMAETLGRDDPSNFSVSWITALLWYAYADATRRAGHLEESLPLFDTAVKRIETMRETDRGRKISSRDSMKTHAERGEVRLQTGDLQGAAADAAACLPFTAAFAIADSRPLDLRDSAYCFELAGDVALRTGDVEAAAHHFDQALLRWTEFGRRNLDSPFLRERIAKATARRAETAGGTREQ
ncbi:MAG TPA: protein kinase [Thermoanaerobaculia bacterium]